ncbi:hypothetical protein GCM10009579_73180 [Streptomyces javensis]|uniref:Uncharacterized protein n=1 Tax=Streptomyces javensis TaxID=114698 RepID=A0ABP4I199_9ACTN
METMGATLEALAAAAPGWLILHTSLGWWDRYERRASNCRLPRTEATRDALARTVGQDGRHLLAAAYAAHAPGWIREVPAVQVLRQVNENGIYLMEIGARHPGGPITRPRTRWPRRLSGLPLAPRTCPAVGRCGRPLLTCVNRPSSKGAGAAIRSAGNAPDSRRLRQWTMRWFNSFGILVPSM